MSTEGGERVEGVGLQRTRHDAAEVAQEGHVGDEHLEHEQQHPGVPFGGHLHEAEHRPRRRLGAVDVHHGEGENHPAEPDALLLEVGQVVEEHHGEEPRRGDVEAPAEQRLPEDREGEDHGADAALEGALERRQDVMLKRMCMKPPWK